VPRGIYQRKGVKHPIDRGAPASVIAEKFGGLKQFAEAVGMTRSTVHRWLVRGAIDGRYHLLITNAAQRKGVKLKPADFVDTRPLEQRGATSGEAVAA